MSALRALGAEPVSAFEHTKSLFRWKVLVQILKQPNTATSSPMIMVLIKTSSLLLQVVVLKLIQVLLNLAAIY